VPSPAARVTALNNVPVVQLDDDFDRAWRRVGLSLDRTGFTVEDRNRTEGVYFVRFVGATDTSNSSKPGFFSNLFSSKASASAPEKYRILVRSTGSNTVVSVLDAQGAPASSANAQRILQLLADDLR
jgi:outer membrane protein assembly factor BamC